MKTNYCTLLNLLKRIIKSGLNKSIVLLILSTCSLSVLANNIAISNVVFTTQNPTLNYSMIKFDVSWDNSWRTSTQESNWDAAWVFVKFKLSSGTAWSHATINYVNGTAAGDGHTQPANSTITTPSDGKGVFIYRSADMAQGSVSYTGVELRWNYGTDGVADNAIVDVDVMAIEMVYIPQASFYLGDGSATPSGNFNVYNSTAAFQITGEGALTLGGAAAGNLRNSNATPGDYDNATTQSLPAAFPKGYNAFYCMKYEVTQEQYTDFLNKLTRAQQETRTGSVVATDAITNVYVMRNAATLAERCAIRCPATGNGTTAPIVFSTVYPHVPSNNMTVGDQLAYLHWAAIRPITEMEYEKAGRGTLAVVADARPWGTTTVTQATGITNGGTVTEAPTNAANCVCQGHASVQGPMRSGCFAGGSRANAGAGYYGVMELAGSLWDFVVTTGHATGRGFTGTHGTGTLNANGNATNGDWPGIVAGEVTSYTGMGGRGGSWWAATANYSRLSDRAQAVLTANTRYNDTGARGARTAP